MRAWAPLIIFLAPIYLSEGLARMIWEKTSVPKIGHCRILESIWFRGNRWNWVREIILKTPQDRYFTIYYLFWWVVTTFVSCWSVVPTGVGFHSQIPDKVHRCQLCLHLPSGYWFRHEKENEWTCTDASQWCIYSSLDGASSDVAFEDL